MFRFLVGVLVLVCVCVCLREDSVVCMNINADDGILLLIIILNLYQSLLFISLLVNNKYILFFNIPDLGHGLKIQHPGPGPLDETIIRHRMEMYSFSIFHSHPGNINIFLFRIYLLK